MYSTRKGQQIHEKLSQLLSQSLCYSSIFCFSDLSLKGATPGLPFLKTRILEVSRFSYNLKLVSQYKMLSCSTGKEIIPWTGCSAQSCEDSGQWEQERSVCVCPYPASWAFCAAQNHWAHWPNPLGWALYLGCTEQTSTALCTNSPSKSPLRQVTPSPGFISVCSVANRISPVIQFQLHIAGQAQSKGNGTGVLEGSNSETSFSISAGH